MKAFPYFLHGQLSALPGLACHGRFPGLVIRDMEFVCGEFRGQSRFNPLLKSYVASNKLTVHQAKASKHQSIRFNLASCTLQVLRTGKRNSN